MAIIEVENLSYAYPNSSEYILQELSLSINQGDFVLLTGPSGCGKTTLCRCLNGLIPHFYRGKLEGNVTVSNFLVKETPISELAQYVGFVFQNPENQLFALSVEKDIAFGLENLAIPRKEIRQNVDWAMDLMGIRDLRQVAPFELSGGQQQRVAIASVLAMKPSIIILDEPTSFLDPVTAWKLFGIIKNLNQELGITIVLVEHRINVLGTLVKRIVVMNKGQIEIEGSPFSVLTSKKARSIGIELPKVTRLHQRLIENGIQLGQSTISINNFAEEIRRAVTYDRG